MTRYLEHPPSEALAPWVRCYWTLQGRPRAPYVQLVVPDACQDLIFRLHDPRDEPAALAVGTMTRPLPVRRDGPTHLLGVRFQPGGAAPFLGLPAPELTDTRAALDDLWGPAATELAERLATLGSVRTRLRALEEHLMGRLASAPAGRDPVIVEAVRYLEATRGAVSVSALARRVELGRRQLGRRFVNAVGVPPKTAARVLRFQSALTHLHDEPDAPLTRVALRAGYHDQPHFTRDFGDLAGEPPGAYRARLSLRTNRP
jgi:methylphosphotriester-DNA--protein-cysteine methyltransferase